ncbi:MAG: alpha/beta hydrolase [Synechococcales cyanobacterium T60_A2020_003]|nr:alpha/beta hydrolase [Synechococcales cyanobacterium T60_A2020_003]
MILNPSFTPVSVRSHLTRIGASVLLNLGLMLGLGCRAEAAERLTVYVGPLQFSVSVNALDKFATGGEATGDLALIMNRLDDETQVEIRRFLQTSVDNSPVVVAQFAYSAMGEDLLQRIGTLIQTQSGINGFHAIRAALILAAADEAEGLTLINVLRQFLSSDLRINLASVEGLVNEIELLSSERERMVEAIAQQSEQMASQIPFMPEEDAPDLRQPGAYSVRQYELAVPIPPLAIAADASIQNETGETLVADLYLPQEVDQSVPLVVVTHSLASTRSRFRYWGEHLASHGIAVVIPEHEGSNAAYLEALMRGEHRNLIDTVEYPRRIHEISSLLDALQQHPEFSSQLNFEQIGVIGTSYGATVALGLAGAELNRDRLQTQCVPDDLTLNLSTLLQCRTNGLPEGDYTLRDPRIRAVIAMFPPTSVIFGPEGLSQIDVPTMVVSASEDQLAPAVEEQIRPFQGASLDDWYLVMLDPANHYILNAVGSEDKAPDFLQSSRPDPAIGRSYIQALSVAFFKTYLGEGELNPGHPIDYKDYLSASYAESIRQDALNFYMLSASEIPIDEP